MFITDAKNLLVELESRGLSIAEYTILEEMESSERTREAVRSEMMEMVTVMKAAVKNATEKPLYSVSGFTGGDAFKFEEYRKEKEPLSGDLIGKSVAMALSCSETNAAMGRIVACPTAGSCGIVPAALLATAEKYGLDDEKIVDALFTSAGIGVIIGEHATVAGAEGGCQAECGSAGAMAAGAIVEMVGGSPKQAFEAGAMVLKTIMGLICDPVAGLVEIPCIKRNATGTANAIVCADMALAGIKSYIPFDEVVDTMYEVGKRMPEDFRETAKGGVAITPTGLELAQKLK